MQPNATTTQPECVICNRAITTQNRPSRPRRYCSTACYKARSRPLSERFWSKVSKNGSTPAHRPDLGPCWPWTGAVDNDGYGKLGRGRRGEGYIRSSRASWELHRGPIPDNLDVLHHCDNPPCVRPDHLFLGTSDDNTRDMVKKGRSQRGVKHHAARLSEDDVREIRSAYANGETTVSLAQRFGIHRMAVYPILSRKKWAHVI